MSLRRLFLLFALLGSVAHADGLPQFGVGQDGRPIYYDRALTPKDLAGRSLRDLTLMRNVVYARAGHPFRKQWLRNYFGAQPWYKPLPKDDNSKITALDRANVKQVAAAEVGYSRPMMVARRDQLAAKKTMNPIEAVELRLLNEQLGAVAGETRPAVKRNPLEDPSQLDRLLSLEELADLSRRDLRILRNTVYARHGRVFKSPFLQAWFDDKEWYQPDPGFKESSLSSVERKNIRLIRSVEDSLGGPETDREQQREEDDWAGQA
jgi:YARHG domain